MLGKIRLTDELLKGISRHDLDVRANWPQSKQNG